MLEPHSFLAGFAAATFLWIFLKYLSRRAPRPPRAEERPTIVGSYLRLYKED